MSNKGLFVVSLLAAVAVGAAGHYFYENKMAGAPGMFDEGALPTDDSTVLVTVNGQKITQAMLDHRKALVAERVGGMFNQLPAPEQDRIVKENLILETLVDQNMKDSNIAQDPEVMEQLRESRQQVLRTAYLDKMADAAVTDEALQKLYDAEMAKTPDVEEIHARHILVKDEAAAKDLIAKIKAGESFEELAKANSLDKGNAPQGGDLGFFTKEQMVPEFSEAAFAMKPGEVSETPVKTAFGWHVIKLEERRTKAKPSFEEMKTGLKAQERQRVMQETIKKWRDSATIEDASAPVVETTDSLETTGGPETTPPPAEADTAPEAVVPTAEEGAAVAPTTEEAAPVAEESVVPASEVPATTEAPAADVTEQAPLETPAGPEAAGVTPETETTTPAPAAAH